MDEDAEVLARREVEAANAAGLLVDWSSCRSACPECGQRGGVEVRQALVAKPLGTFSLSGTGMKFPARWGWMYRCVCGASGPAEPK